jgi:hypothetical protein
MTAMEIIYDVRQRVHADPHFVAGIQPQPGCSTCAAEVERNYGRKTRGTRAVRRNSDSAGRFPDGPSIVAPSQAEKSHIFA